MIGNFFARPNFISPFQQLGIPANAPVFLPGFGIPSPLAGYPGGFVPPNPFLTANFGGGVNPFVNQVMNPWISPQAQQGFGGQQIPLHPALISQLAQQAALANTIYGNAVNPLTAQTLGQFIPAQTV